MDQTPRLSLPFIMSGQAQKHITHNQALQALDALVQPAVESRTLATPPVAPLEGENYLVPAGATGAWAGHADEVASYQSGAWLWLDPAPGWHLYCKADQTLLVFDAGSWVPLASLGSALARLGINTAADNTNRFAVAAAASLFTHAGNGHQLKLNKAAPADTASLLYQTNWSGRAEMGLAGDDNWQIKLSADGASWTTALTLDSASATARFGGSVLPALDNALTLGDAGARWSAIWSATGTIQTSDARQKTDIAPTDLGLDFILALKPVRFRYQGDGGDGGRARTHYGLLAQDVQHVLAGRDFAGHVLADPADPHSEQGLRYDAFIAPLIAAVQAIAARLDAVEIRSAGRGSAP